MFSICPPKIYLHPASQNFPIDMRELCETPESKCSSIPLDDKWGNASVHCVFDGSLFPHADETKIV